MEPLLEAVRQDPEYMRLTTEGVGVRIAGYADDTTGYVASADDVECLFKWVRKYSRQSGAKLNVSKSSLLFLNGRTPWLLYRDAKALEKREEDRWTTTIT